MNINNEGGNAMAESNNGQSAVRISPREKDGGRARFELTH